MKNLIYIAIAAIFAAPAMAQPVSDRGVIPVAVTLNQVLRLNITSGGNIEFVFNTIAQYKAGIGPGAFYETDFFVASSTAWELDMGAEDALFQGTDNPANTMPLDNVGFAITEAGLHDFGVELDDIAGVVAGIALPVYPTLIIGSILPSNAGDEDDNDFTILWECGTTPAGGIVTMNATFLIDQTLTPDRYVTNVLLDLRSP